MNKTVKILMNLIGSEVCGTPLSMPAGTVITDVTLSQLYETANVHDVAHLVGSALMSNNLLFGSAFEGMFRDRVLDAVLKSEKQDYDFGKIRNVFEKERIPFIPLKGTVIKNLYPERWMRTSCDIDILIHREDLKKATMRFCDELGFVQKNVGKHDVSFVTQENVCVELHFSLMEKKGEEKYSAILEKVWDYAEPVQSGRYRYFIKDEMLYFYHIAHMAKHFENGGCGVRPFVDLWLLEKDGCYRTPETCALLKEGGLLAFADYAEKLCEVWFSQKEHDEVTSLMEKYILEGGSFGSDKTRIMAAELNGGGNYVISRLFVPYDFLKKQYPVIEKHKFLTPIFELVRLFSLAFGKRKNFRKKRIEKIKNITEDQTCATTFLFENLGLK